MTCIAVKKEKDKIYIVADTEFTQGYDKISKSFGSQIKDHSKVFQFNGVTVGVSGLLEDGLVIKQYIKTNIPKGSRLDDIEDYILGIYQHLMNRKSGRVAEIQIILIYEGKIFKATGYEIYEVSEYDSIGSGMFYARTVMYLGHPARKAVEVAIEFAYGVGGNIDEIIIPLQ